MPNIVAILGAGASKEAGAPVMREFLDRARLLRLGGSPPNRDDFDNVFRAIGKLQQVHSKAQLDIYNVEDVFAAFEIAQVLGGFADYDTEGTGELLRELRAVIVATLNDAIRLSPKGDQLPPPAASLAFAEFVQLAQRQRGERNSVTVITFNYDLSIDYALGFVGAHPNYLLDPHAPVGGVHLLKLHGSLNWFRCGTCPSLVTAPIRAPQVAPSKLAMLQRERFQIQIGGPLRHCDAPTENTPFLVPPTFSKSDYHRLLTPVWTAAAKALHVADFVLVFGFSLTPSDRFFNYLYALGTIGDDPLRGFHVYDPDPSVEQRYKRLLGPGARTHFRFHPERFGSALQGIGQFLEGLAF